MSNWLERLGHMAQLFITVSVLAAFFGVIYMLLTIKADLPAGIREVLLVLVGVLAGAFKDVVGYFMGSSLSSAKKDQRPAQ